MKWEHAWYAQETKEASVVRLMSKGRSRHLAWGTGAADCTGPCDL